jgi:hypothetical protein
VASATDTVHILLPTSSGKQSCVCFISILLKLRFSASVVVHLSKFVAAPSVSRLQLLIMARRASLKTAQVLRSCKLFLIETRWCAFHKTVLQLLQNNNKRKRIHEFLF